MAKFLLASLALHILSPPPGPSITIITACSSCCARPHYSRYQARFFLVFRRPQSASFRRRLSFTVALVYRVSLVLVGLARRAPASFTIMSVMMDSHSRPPHQRNRSSFSFRSTKSDRSTKIKMDLRETARDKARTHLTETTKANPNAAMNEAQPSRSSPFTPCTRAVAAWASR